MTEDSVFYVGVDVSKAKHAIAIAESGRNGEVRYFGEIEATPAAVERFVRKLESKSRRLHFCYEAGPTGYGPRQLMAFLGLVPSERSTGETVKRGGLTLAGNRRARRVLVEGAWSRHPARVTETIRVRLEGLPKAVREIAWKAQTRLCGRYRRLTAAGKKNPIVVAAIAREMAAFLWAIGHQVEPVR